MQGGNNEGFLSAPMAGIQTIGEIIQAEHVPWKRLIGPHFFKCNMLSQCGVAGKGSFSLLRMRLLW